jgi:3-oxoacyl-[acyl-carrier protein] reductase
MTDLKHKVALVTGSSRGIGAAIAKCFARHGAKVALHGRDIAALDAVRAEIEATHGEVMQVTGEVTKFADLEAMRRQIEDTFGPIEILVANAGKNYTRPNLPLEETPEDGWRTSIEGNLTATFLTLKSVLPQMKLRRKGTIITISSAAARRPNPASPLPYAAAKAGIELLTQHVAAQAGPYDIRVNCIAPETILTETNQRQIPDAQKSVLIDAHPLKRLGTPDDVASAALFLASEEAGWISGVILDVAGGAVLVR